MGLIEVPDSGEYTFWQVENKTINDAFSITTDLEYATAEEIPYHLSWDFLMPVVEKINSQRYLLKKTYFIRVEIHPAYTLIRATPGENELRISKTEDSMLESTYEAVIEYIKWYNKNKK